jgi:hypothetical protein
MSAEGRIPGVISLIRTEMVLETLVYSPFDHLTRLLA